MVFLWFSYIAMIDIEMNTTWYDHGTVMERSERPPFLCVHFSPASMAGAELLAVPCSQRFHDVRSEKGNKHYTPT